MQFFKTCFSAMVLSAAGLIGAAKAETFIITSNIPPTHFLIKQGLDPWMACVAKKTNGQVEFNHFHSGQIAGIYQSVDAVNSGLAHIALTTPTFLSERLPLNGILLLPSIGGSVVETTKAHRKVLTEEGPLREELDKNGLRIVMVQVHSGFQILSTGKPVDTLESFKGKKISSGGGTLQLALNGLGASAIELPATDIYVAMQQGTIDGTLLGLASSSSYKLNEVTKSVSANGSFGTSNTYWVMDSKMWAGLDPAKQQAMTDCAIDVETALVDWIVKRDEEIKNEFKGKGITVYQYSDGDLASMGKKLDSVRDEYIGRLTARGLPGKAAYDSYIKALGR